MQIRPNSWAITRQAETALGLITKSAVAFSLSYAMRLSLPSAILFGLIFAIIFIISGSIARGLTNFFLSIALTSVFSSILFLFKFGIDRPSTVFLATVFLSIFLSRISTKNSNETNRENSYFDSITAIVLIASAHLFHKLANLESTKLFGILLPEDNAAWVHASSGFLRFNASAGLVSSMQYGSSSFASNLFSVVSIPTRLFSSENGAVLSLANVANTYVFLLITLIYMSSATCREIFHMRNQTKAFRKIMSNGKYVLIGILSVIGVGKIFLNSGHLSLILSLVIFWIVTYQFQISSNSVFHISGAPNLWNLNLAILSAYTIGVVWFPMVPVSVLTIVVIVVGLIATNRHTVFHFRVKVRNIVVIGNVILFLMILLAALTQLRVPTGYSISSLINVGTGGTFVPTAIGLSLALVGFIIAIESVGKNVVLPIFISLFPLGLLAYWIATMSENPVSPGYSVEKFSLLVTLIGLPLAIGFSFRYLEAIQKHVLSSVVSPVLLCFAVAHISWGINSFPRDAMTNKDNWTINYLRTLLAQSAYNPDAQLLCLSGNAESDMSAYMCSRFGSALQFREFSNNNLARRWRSQVLEANLDLANFPKGTVDFDVPSNISNFVNNGGKLIVILTPGPFWQIEQRLERPWMQELPWDAIKVVQ
jgi:hypothetical protein